MPKSSAEKAKVANKPWPMVRLGDVCEIIAGQSPEGENYTNDDSHLEFHQGCKSFGQRYLERSGVYTKKITKIAESGSILMSVRAPVGTVNITTRRVCIGRGLAALISNNCILRDYLYNYLLAVPESLNKVAGTGTVFPSISRGQLLNFPIPLPPLDVQREIVARLEKELGEAGKLAAKFREIAAKADEEFKAELDETFKQMEGEKVRLGDVCVVVAGQSPEGENYTNDASYLEFHQGCKSFGQQYLEISGVYTKKATKIAESGSILMSVRAPVGTVNITTRRVCIGRGLAALMPNGRIIRDYLYDYLLSVPERLNQVAGAGTVFPSISRGQLLNFPIPLPPLAIQREIVAKLDAAKERCEKLKAAAERGLRETENLRKSILAEAFE